MGPQYIHATLIFQICFFWRFAVCVAWTGGLHHATSLNRINEGLFCFFMFIELYLNVAFNKSRKYLGLNWNICVNLSAFVIKIDT